MKTYAALIEIYFIFISSILEIDVNLFSENYFSFNGFEFLDSCPSIFLGWCVINGSELRLNCCFGFNVL